MLNEFLLCQAAAEMSYMALDKLCFTLRDRGPSYKMSSNAVLTTVFYVKNVADSNKSKLINLF